MTDKTPDYQSITFELLMQIKNKLNIKTDKEFCKRFNLNKSSLSQWSKGANIPEHVKLAFYYINQYYITKIELERLKKQLSTDNQSELKKEVDQLSIKLDELTKQFEQFKTSLNKKQD